MEKDFVPYKLAVKLKALGYDEPCFGYYNLKGVFTGTKVFRQDHYVNQYALSPLYQQAFRWFREKNFYVSINTYHSVNEDKPFGLSIDYLHKSGKWDYLDYRGEIDFKTYEEAELAGLTKLIEIVETRTN